MGGGNSEMLLPAEPVEQLGDWNVRVGDFQIAEAGGYDECDPYQSEGAQIRFRYG